MATALLTKPAKQANKPKSYARKEPPERAADGKPIWGRHPEKGYPVCFYNDRCMSPYRMDNGRCRVHCGNIKRGAEHHSFKNGQYSAYARLLSEDEWKAFQLQLQSPQALSLLEDVVFTSTRIGRAVEDLTSLPEDLTERLETIASDVQLIASDPDSDPEDVRRAALLLTEVVDTCLNGSKVYREIERLQDHKRKLVETESKRIFNNANTMPTARVYVLVGRIFQSVQVHFEKHIMPLVGEGPAKAFFNAVSDDFKGQTLVQPQKALDQK
jgi:hypothetical protein